VTDTSRPHRDVVNKIFGDELPQKTADERDNDSPAEAADHEQWLRDNIPPHHD
jgi:hypothetical protein